MCWYHHTDNETEQEHYNDMWILQANQNAFRAFEVRREKDIISSLLYKSHTTAHSTPAISHIGIGFEWTCTGMWIIIFTSNCENIYIYHLKTGLVWLVVTNQTRPVLRWYLTIFNIIIGLAHGFPNFSILGPT